MPGDFSRPGAPGFRLIFQPETPRDARATEEGREALRQDARARNKTTEAKAQAPIKSEIQRLQEQIARESSKGARSKARAEKELGPQLQRAERALAKREAKEARRQERRDRLDAWRADRQAKKDAKKAERDAKKEARREARKKERQERKDKAAKRTEGAPEGGQAIDSEFQYLLELGRSNVEADRREYRDRLLDLGISLDEATYWSTFGDYNLANVPIPYLGEPGVEGVEQHGAFLTGVMGAIQAVMLGAFGGPGFGDFNLGIVSHSRPGKDATGSRIGTHTTAYPGQEVAIGETLQDAALAITSTLVAAGGARIAASGTGLLEVVREHRGEGAIADDRPAIMVENRNVQSVKQDGLNSEGPPSFAGDVDLKGTIGPGGDFHATGLEVNKFPDQTGDLLVVQAIDGKTREGTDKFVEVANEGALRTHVAQELVDLESHPDPAEHTQLYNVGGTLYQQTTDGTQTSLTATGEASSGLTGTGEDGALTVSSNTTLSGVNMHTTVTVNSSYYVYPSVNDAQIVLATGAAAINGTVFLRGKGAGGASGGTGRAGNTDANGGQGSSIAGTIAHANLTAGGGGGGGGGAWGAGYTGGSCGNAADRTVALDGAGANNNGSGGAAPGGAGSAGGTATAYTFRTDLLNAVLPAQRALPPTFWRGGGFGSGGGGGANKNRGASNAGTAGSGGSTGSGIGTDPGAGGAGSQGGAAECDTGVNASTGSGGGGAGARGAAAGFWLVGGALSGSGTLDARGSDGGDGGAGGDITFTNASGGDSATGAGGGAGGGSGGGLLAVLTLGADSSTFTTQDAGGSGGTGGSAGALNGESGEVGGAGGNGGNGEQGYVIVEEIAA